LSQDELFAYWRRLDDVKPLPMRTALKLAVLLGGQRPAQLLRLRRSDVDLEAGRLVLFDSKGARADPRQHELPITDRARTVLEPAVAAAAKMDSEWVFTSNGSASVVPESLSTEVREIMKMMHEAREVSEPFSLRDVRRTVETTLAALAVCPRFARADSIHGLSGIQHKHYNRHDYRSEKREVLERWAGWLLAGPTQPSKVIGGRKVVPIRKRRAAVELECRNHNPLVGVRLNPFQYRLEIEISDS
jgi:integrase